MYCYSIRRVTFTCNECNNYAKFLYPEERRSHRSTSKSHPRLRDLVSLTCDTPNCAYFGSTVEGGIVRRVYWSTVEDGIMRRASKLVEIHKKPRTSETFSESSEKHSDLFPFAMNVVLVEKYCD